MHTARGKAHSALQRQKLIAEQNTKRATLSPPPRTLYVCVCVCVSERQKQRREYGCKLALHPHLH